MVQNILCDKGELRLQVESNFKYWRVMTPKAKAWPYTQFWKRQGSAAEDIADSQCGNVASGLDNSR